MKNNNKNTKTLRFLKEQEYDMNAIRAAVVKLAGLRHEDLARKIGTHRTVVTNTLNEVKYRKSIRADIAEILDVPVEEFFDEPTTDSELQQGNAGG